ncbi:MAG: DsbE family thiol:disulfide interchange protein [Roseovarius sp.]|nr:DsbE family thiol:disulfide interchange protein [Roseovarius sp.]
MNAMEEPRRKKCRFLTMLPVAIFAFIGAGFYWGLLNGDGSLPSPLIGKPVPEFDLPPIEGRSDGLSTSDLKGQVSIVNVWASWCVPCRVEMPLLNELAGRDEVTIFGINYKDRPEEALGFLNELGDPYTRIGADWNGRVSIEWGVYGLPETFVIDPEGRIAYKHIGPFNRRSLEEDILPVVRRLQEGAGS